MANNDNYEYMRFLDLTGVQQIWDTAKQTFVQTVNGQGIDENGNVNVSGGGGSLTTDEENFVKDEYNKTLNMIGIELGGAWNDEYPFTISYGPIRARSRNIIAVKPNTTYTLKSTDGASNIQFAIQEAEAIGSSTNFYDSGWQGTNNTYTFTTRATTNYLMVNIRKSDNASLTTAIIGNIMMNKGDTALTYQAYNGAVAHQGDIDAVLIWQNATPTNAFNGQTLSNLPDYRNFKYLVIMYKCYKDSGYGALCFKIKNEQNCQYFINMLDIARTITTTSATSITFSSERVTYTGAAGSNNNFIPVAIYGTNIL